MSEQYGDEFYINFEIISDFFANESLDTLAELLQNRRKAALMRANQEGKTIKDVIISSPEGLDRLEVRYIYG